MRGRAFLFPLALGLTLVIVLLGAARTSAAEAVGVGGSDDTAQLRPELNRQLCSHGSLSAFSGWISLGSKTEENCRWTPMQLARIVSPVSPSEAPWHLVWRRDLVHIAGPRWATQDVQADGEGQTPDRGVSTKGGHQACPLARKSTCNHYLLLF